MLPDFSHLRKEERDRASSQSSNPSQHKGFGKPTTSQRFPKQPRIQPLSAAERAFFGIWTTCPSWSPIIHKPNGWLTIVNRSGKKVPLVLGTIASHYRRGFTLGKRSGKLTNYLMVDVDTGSPFHPRNGGIEPIIAAMESIGLCRCLIVRSSSSGGLHLYFPLAEPVSSYGLACAAHTALTTAGVRVAGGICELFPNKKAFNAEHNGHRLPLQKGSFLLDSDFRCISNDKATFVQQWHLCAKAQDEALLADLLIEKPLPIPKYVSVSSLPPIAWTKAGQSNDIMRQLVNYGDRYLGLNTIPTLGNWMVAVAPQLPGFEQFASEESKNDLTRRNWAYRWAKSHFKSVRNYNAKTSYDHNAVVAAEALERLKLVLNQIVLVSKLGVRKLLDALSAKSRELFGVGFSWGLFKKHRKLIMEKVGDLCQLGLSTGRKKGKNSDSEETATAEESGAVAEQKKPLTELLTARSVTASSNKGCKASRTPLKQTTEPVAEGRPSAPELAMGTVVVVKQPGSDADGVQTRVTGKTSAADGMLRYRLEHCVDGQPLLLSGECLVAVSDEASTTAAEGVLRATAQQLRQVLGKACPFVGPGLWTVRRDEVSLLAWRQLRHLVGEG